MEIGKREEYSNIESSNRFNGQASHGREGGARCGAGCSGRQALEGGSQRRPLNAKFGNG